MKRIPLWLFLVASVVHGQEVVDTGKGSYRKFLDRYERCVRTEASDGVVVEYLYDSPSADRESGVVVKVPNGPVLKVQYDDHGSISTPGMPKLNVIKNGENRVAEIRADKTPIATFEYGADRYVKAVSIPGHFSMRFTPPDARHHMRQTLIDAGGKVLHETDVFSRAYDFGIWDRPAYDGVAQALGFEPRSLSIERSPDGYLGIARDANGHIVLYDVTTPSGSLVAFTPDGVPRYYDLAVEIWDWEIPTGSDVGASVSYEQNLAVPAHVTLTAGGMPGVYINAPANGAIYAVWVESDGHGGTVTKYARATVTDTPTPAKR